LLAVSVFFFPSPLTCFQSGAANVNIKKTRNVADGENQNTSKCFLGGTMQLASFVFL
jgi:hypothetical protein